MADDTFRTVLPLFKAIDLGGGVYGAAVSERTIAKAAIFNTALPAAEADWLGAVITPTGSPSYLRIYVCVSVAGILRIRRTVAAVTVTENLNSAVALTAGAAYMFTVPWRTGDDINLRYSVTAGTIECLRIEEGGA